MIKAPRTFKITSGEPMSGLDVREYQKELLDRFLKWNINYPIAVDGIYGSDTRSATATFLRAWGAKSAADLMKEGVTPRLRTKMRHDDRNKDEASLFHSTEREEFRAKLREKFKVTNVSYPILRSHLITDEWGYHGSAHDGIDLMCPWKEPILAVCEAKVVDVRSMGWWGKGAIPSGGHPVSDGDGIIIIQATDDFGPHISKGDCFGYGHSENHIVTEGQTVKAGQRLGTAGYANGAHVHFMQNTGTFAATQGRGDTDPRPALNWLEDN